MKSQHPCRNFWTNFFLTVALFILLLLISNVLVIWYAISMNKYICSQAARAGAAAFTRGGSQREIESAVFRAVNRSDVHNFCMNQPELGELRFYVKYEKGRREDMLLVRTVTGVRVPAPFLLFVRQPEANGRLRFNSSYAIKLSDSNIS